MIKYKIIVSNTRNVKVETNKKVHPSDPNFKETVFERSLRSCYWRENMRCKLRGTSRLGTIVEVEKDINKINWHKNRPNYLVIQFDDGEVGYVNPCQIKGTKK